MSTVLRSKSKKFITLLLTLLMVFGAAIPALSSAAWAEDPNTNAAEVQLVTSGTPWLYLDDNNDPFLSTTLYQVGLTMGFTEAQLAPYRIAWTAPHSPYSNASVDAAAGQTVDIGMDDSAWNTANGPFGFKNGNASYSPYVPYTEINGSIPGTSDRVTTYFFRYNFDLSDASPFHSLSYKIRYDDAFILYLNGEEIGRHNTPDGGYAQNLQYGCAGVSGDYLDAEAVVSVPAGLLRNGSNTLAVELHNDRAASSDIYLNVENISLSETYVSSGEAPEIVDLTFQPGADESQRNFTWLSNATASGALTLWTDGGTPVVFDAVAANLSKRDGYLTNKVTVTGLAPGTTYRYKVSNGDPAAGGATSAEYSFTTDASTDAFSFLLVGDPQIGSSRNVPNDTAGWQGTVTRSLAAWPELSFIISAGDQVETPDMEEHYTGYLSPVQLPGIPVAPTVGNHDNSANYLGHYNPPNLDNNLGATVAGGDYWYAYGDVLFMHINSNNMSTAQHKAFLQNAIAAYKIDRDADPAWKIVVFHHSIFSSASHTTEWDIQQRRTEWSPLFSELDIDAVLAGHDHVYTRSFVMNGVSNDVSPGGGTSPITEGYTVVEDNAYAAYTKTNPGETVYITANSASGSKFYAIHDTDYPFVAKEDQKNRPTVTKIDVGADALTFNTYYTNEDVNTGSPIDSFTLKRETATTPPDDGTVSAEIRGDAATIKGSPVSYTVSLSNLKDVGVVTLGVTASGAHLDLKDVTALNGFTALNGIVWESLGNDIWKGTVTLAYTAGGGLLSAAGPLDVVTISGTARDIVAETTVSLTDIQVAGNVNGASGALPSEIKTAEATTSVTEQQAVYSPYDLNRDGAIDALDLTIAVYYYLASGADPDWESVKFDVASAKDADVTGDAIVNLADLIEILANYQTSYNLWP